MPEKLVAEMTAYHEELAKAGALLDGPFTEAKELVAGYTLIQAKSRDDAMEWSRRFPNPSVEGKEAEIEVRQLFDPEDFGPVLGIGPEAAERFRRIGIGDW